MCKNRKSFIAVMQAKGKKIRARIYRVKRNRPVYLGFVKFGKMPESAKERDIIIDGFLKYNGHVLASHSAGDQFIMEVV